MLLIFEKVNGNIVSTCTDSDNNSLQTLFSTNFQFISLHSEIIVPYDKNIIENYKNYRIVNQNGNLIVLPKPVFELSLTKTKAIIGEIIQLTIIQKSDFLPQDSLDYNQLFIKDNINVLSVQILPFPNPLLTIDLDFDYKGYYFLEMCSRLYSFNKVGVLIE